MSFVASQNVQIKWYSSDSNDFVRTQMGLNGEIENDILTIQLKPVQFGTLVFEYSEKLSDVMEQNDICPELANAILADHDILLGCLDSGDVKISMTCRDSIMVKFTIEHEGLKGDFKLECNMVNTIDKINELEHELAKTRNKLEKYIKRNDELIEMLRRVTIIIPRIYRAKLNILDDDIENLTKSISNEELID